MISDWEQSVGNAVAKGIREHGGKTPKATSMSDMERYMNVRWSKYTPSQKRDWFLMDLNFGHSNKNTKRYLRKATNMVGIEQEKMQEMANSCIWSQEVKTSSIQASEKMVCFMIRVHGRDLRILG